MRDTRLSRQLRRWLTVQGATVTWASVAFWPQRREHRSGVAARWVDGPTRQQVEQWALDVVGPDAWTSVRRYRSWGQLLVAHRHVLDLQAWIEQDLPPLTDDDPAATMSAAYRLDVDPNRWPHGNMSPAAIAEKVADLQAV